MKTTAPHSWWATASPDEIHDRQLRTLRHFLKTRVIPFSAHYRRAFGQAGVNPAALRSLADLEKLPFTEKGDLLNTPEQPQRSRDFVLIPDEAVLSHQPEIIGRALLHGRRRVKEELEREFRPLLLTSTTGRSSDPVPFVYTAHDLDILTLAGRRMMEVGASRPEFRHANLFPFAPHLAFWQAHYAGLGFNTFCLSTGGGKVLGTEGNVALLDKVKPEVLIGMPTFLYHLLRQAAAENRQWPQLKKLVLGGEKVPDGLRKKLRALASGLGAGPVDVLATYGFTEAKMAFMECPPPPGGEASGYHLYPDFGLVEVIDPATGRQVREGHPGEIVYTSLDSRGTVVVRYRTGDRIDGGLYTAPCLYCGRTCPRLVGSISRVSEVRSLATDKVKGTLVDFNTLERALDDLDGLGAWQIELRKLHDDPFECDEIIVHAATDRAAGRADLEHSITRRFADAAEVRPNRIIWHDPAELREMHGVGRLLKEEKILDRRPLSLPPASPN